MMRLLIALLFLGPSFSLAMDCVDFSGTWKTNDPLSCQGSEIVVKQTDCKSVQFPNDIYVVGETSNRSGQFAFWNQKKAELWVERNGISTLGIAVPPYQVETSLVRDIFVIKLLDANTLKTTTSFSGTKIITSASWDDNTNDLISDGVYIREEPISFKKVCTYKR